jgi:soluble lytic murein transglycosylase-like protein
VHCSLHGLGAIAVPQSRCSVRRRAVLSALALLASSPSMAQIYASAPGPDSSVVLSNFRSNETPILLVDAAAAYRESAPAALARRSRGSLVAPTALPLPAASVEINQLIQDVAAQVQIAPELLHAVIAAESRYNPRAVSPRGAIGLMQLLPATANRFGIRDPFVARDNVFAGASYLKWLMGEFQDDLELVLAAYNAGEQAVVKAGGRIPPYPETQAYVPRVLAYLRCASSVACRAN